MKAFMDEHFLLKNETAKRLYHQYAEHMPIIGLRLSIPILRSIGEWSVNCRLIVTNKIV